MTGIIAVLFLEAVPGFERGGTGLADLCLTTWLHRHTYNVISISYLFEKVNRKYSFYFSAPGNAIMKWNF